MEPESKGVSVKILDKEFQIACPVGAESELKEAARYLDRQMREIRKRGRVIGIERIAIMAALNLSHLHLFKKAPEQNHLSDRLQIMHQKIDDALTQAGVNSQLEVGDYSLDNTSPNDETPLELEKAVLEPEFQE